MATESNLDRSTRRKSERPLRRDAEANRLRILEAAGRIFAERGLDVAMEDIATAAKVGVGTLYRRFPEKEELIDALFGQRIAQVAQVAKDSFDVDDPWEALETFMHRALTMQIADRGLAEALTGRPGRRKKVEHARATIDPLVNQIVERAQASGQLRPDITGPDLAVVAMMIASLARRLQPTRPDLWERYFDLVLDGLRTTRPAPTQLKSDPIDPTVLHPLMLPNS